ncbi:MAG: glycyl-radical enzyme activating protein family, partial [Clostridia bacterium]|nr:glycyl-radical enzyme activating protein family [Clostridia bacterium]
MQQIKKSKVKNMKQINGTIFNIQNFSIHDGPGVRTVVFFKGCNLRCRWCHNPESLSLRPQLMFYNEKCIDCGKCVERCDYSAHTLDSFENHKHIFERKKCTGCISCVDTCYAEALMSVGETVSVDYVMKTILSEKVYYGDTGGVTLSGGECMLQPEFLTEILKECKANGIHTAVDTAGNVPWNSFEHILEFTDLFLYDIKAADRTLHYEYTNA